MRLKFFSGLALLLVILLAQVWLASAGIYLDLAFAALISFAFLFNFWELVVYILFTVLLINWQPTVSLEIFIIALFPIIASFSFISRSRMAISHGVYFSVTLGRDCC